MLIGTTFKTCGASERYAIETWLRAPTVKVLFLGDTTWDAYAIFNAMTHVAYHQLPTTRPSGVPQFNSMVSLAGDVAARIGDGLTCIMNADIYIDTPQIPYVEGWLLDHAQPFLAVGQRIEADGTYLPPCGCDYFIMPTYHARNIVIPPFAIGRCTFDNWMMYNALKTGVPLIDLTGVFDVYHQKHPESAASRLGPDAQENLRLAKESYPDWNPRKGWVNEANERPTKEEVYGLSRVRSGHPMSHLPTSG